LDFHKGILILEMHGTNIKKCNIIYALPFKAYRLLYVPPGLTFKNFVCQLHCIYVFYVAVRTNSKFALYIINWLVFITEDERVYCAVRSESLYNMDTSRPLTL